MPDSMLAAAKKLAQVANLPWPRVQKYYRSLQESAEVGSAKEGWMPPHDWQGLPKSKGRAVWAAHPNFMVRLLIAIAGADTPEGSRRALETFIFATENGEGGPERLEDALSRALTDEGASADIDLVEFHSDTARVCIHSKARGPVWYWIDEEEMQADGSTAPVARRQGLIRSRGIIDGGLFRALRSEISWRFDTDWPLVGDDGATEE